jgi:predicted nuclease of restriction endonuclease-like RecB superfamily
VHLLEYLRHKIQKINQLAEKESIILLVNTNLSCSGSEFQTDNSCSMIENFPIWK